MKAIKNNKLAVSVAFLSALGCGVAWAAVNFSKIAFVDGGMNLTANGKITGLANGTVVVAETAIGYPVVTCYNPGGEPVGSKTFTSTVAVSGTSQPITTAKNGSASYIVTTTIPSDWTLDPSECTNGAGGWTAKVTNVRFLTATLTATQGSSVVSSETCTFTNTPPGTDDGSVPAKSIKCTP